MSTKSCRIRSESLHAVYTTENVARVFYLFLFGPLRGEMIEDYPEDVRGHSCLLLGIDLEGRPIHVVCSPKPEFLAIITAYTPEPKEWDSSFRVRKKA